MQHGMLEGVEVMARGKTWEELKDIDKDLSLLQVVRMLKGVKYTPVSATPCPFCLHCGLKVYITPELKCPSCEELVSLHRYATIYDPATEKVTDDGSVPLLIDAREYLGGYERTIKSSLAKAGLWDTRLYKLWQEYLANGDPNILWHKPTSTFQFKHLKTRKAK